MSKAEKIILWIVWAVVALAGLGVPLAWFAYVQFGLAGTTNVAVVITPTRLSFLVLVVGCVVSLAVWTIHRTRRKAL